MEAAVSASGAWEAPYQGWMHPADAKTASFKGRGGPNFHQEQGGRSASGALMFWCSFDLLCPPCPFLGRLRCNEKDIKIRSTRIIFLLLKAFERSFEGLSKAFERSSKAFSRPSSSIHRSLKSLQKDNSEEKSYSNRQWRANLKITRNILKSCKHQNND